MTSSSQDRWKELITLLWSLPSTVASTCILLNETLAVATNHLKLLERGEDNQYLCPSLCSLIEVELPPAVEALLGPVGGACSPLEAAQIGDFLMNVSMFAAHVFRSKALADGEGAANMVPLLHTLIHMLGPAAPPSPPRYPIPVPESEGFGPNFRVPPVQAKIEGESFYVTHGRPKMRSYQGRTMHVWPDSYSARCGEDAAIGWIMEVFLIPKTLAPPVALVAAGGAAVGALAIGNSEAPRWVRGKVVRFDGDCHVLLMEEETIEKGGKVAKDVTLHLPSYDVHWINGREGKSDGKLPPGFEQDSTKSESRNGQKQGKSLGRPPLSAATMDLSIYRLRCIDAFTLNGGFIAIASRLDMVSTATAALEEGYKRVPGMDAGRHMYKEKESVPAAEVLVALQLTVETLPLLPPPTWRIRVCWDIKEAAPRALLSIAGEALRSVPKEAMTAAVNRVAVLAAESCGRNSTTPQAAAAVTAATSQLKLGLAMRAFRCPQLERRLSGLVEIRELVIAVTAPASASPTPTTQWATPAIVAQWLIEEQFVEELLGGSCHAELVKRSGVVLSFLARLGCLTSLHLQCLWTAPEGVHEAVAAVFHSTILSLLPSLPPHHRLSLFNAIAATPYSQYTKQTLILIRDYTVAALKAARPPPVTVPAGTGTAGNANTLTPIAPDTPTTSTNTTNNEAVSTSAGRVVHWSARSWMGFGLLWQFATAESTSSGATTTEVGGDGRALVLAEVAAELLIGLLSEPEIAPERGPLVTRCLDNLRHHKSVPVSLMVLRGAIATLPNTSVRWYDKVATLGIGRSTAAARDATSSTALLESLQKNHDLIGALFEELESYSEDTNARRGGGRLSHIQQLRMRLDFLLFTLRTGGLTLKEEQLDILWRCLIDGASSSSACDIAMDWLQNACANALVPPSYPHISNGSSTHITPASHSAITNTAAMEETIGTDPPAGASAALYVFSVKLPPALGTAVRPSAARLFLSLFLHTNARARAIKWEKVSMLGGSGSGRDKNDSVKEGGGYGYSGEGYGYGWVRHSLELKGEEGPWGLALDAEDAEVARIACLLLVDLHRCLGPKLSTMKGDSVAHHFFQMCFARLAASVPSKVARTASAASPSGGLTSPPPALRSPTKPATSGFFSAPAPHTVVSAVSDQLVATSVAQSAAPALKARRVKRCLRLLRLFIGCMNNGPGSQEMVHVEIGTGAKCQPTVEIMMRCSASAYELRAEVARHFDVSPRELVLYRRAPVPTGPPGPVSTFPSAPPWIKLELNKALEDALPVIPPYVPVAEVPSEKKLVLMVQRAGGEAQPNAVPPEPGDIIIPEEVTSYQPPSPSRWELLRPPELHASGTRSLRRNSREALPEPANKDGIVLTSPSSGSGNASSTSSPPLATRMTISTSTQAFPSSSPTIVPPSVPTPVAAVPVARQSWLTLRNVTSLRKMTPVTPTGASLDIAALPPPPGPGFKLRRSVSASSTASFGSLEAATAVALSAAAEGTNAGAPIQRSAVHFPDWPPPLAKRAEVSLSTSVGGHAKDGGDTATLHRTPSRTSLLSMRRGSASTANNSAAAPSDDDTIMLEGELGSIIVAPSSSSSTAPASATPSATAFQHDLLFAILDAEVEKVDNRVMQNNSDGRPSPIETAEDGDSGLISSVWQLLSSLPANVHLISSLRTLSSVTTTANTVPNHNGSNRRNENPNSGIGWELALDPSSPHKLLYSLQVISSFLTLPPSMGAHGKEAALTWCLRFSLLGGTTHLCRCLRRLRRRLVESINQQNFGGSGAGRSNDSMSISVAAVVEARVLCAAQISWLLHRLLQLGGAYFAACGPYSQWEIATLYHHKPRGGAGDATSRTGGLSSAVSDAVGGAGLEGPIEMVVSDTMQLLQGLVRYTVSGGVSVGGGSSTVFKTPATVNSVTSPLTSALLHGLELVAVALSSMGDGAAPFLRNFPKFDSWLKAFILKSPDPIIRRAAGSLLYRACVSQGIVCPPRVSVPPPAPDAGLPSLASLILESLLPMFTTPAVAVSPTIPAGSATSTSRDREQCAELCALIGGLLLMRLESGAGAGIEEQQVAQEAGTRLANHVFAEQLGSEATDWSLIGLLRLLRCMIGAAPELGAFAATAFARASGVALDRNTTTSDAVPFFLRFLINDCLFPPLNNGSSDTTSSLSSPGVDRSAGPKCMTLESRAAVFDLIAEISRRPAGQKEILQLLGGRDLVQELFIEDQDSPTGAKNAPVSDMDTIALELQNDSLLPWDYNPSDCVKESGCHVGLHNLGATCYINCLLQQLYHCSSFSNPLLEISAESGLEVPGSIDVESGASGSTEQQRLLFQLQVLFAFLRVSHRQAHDTRAFCGAFNDYDGRPIRVMEQKDAYEFCSMLLDKLEASDPAVKQLIKENFGGTLQYHVISQDCPHNSRREEPFFILTAEVQNKNSLASSLDLFVAGETLSGDNRYHCEICNRRVAARRRCAVAVLPPTLILHLKRFEFDLGTMTRHKLNHCVTFPNTLDMEPWTVEGIEAREIFERARGASAMSLTAEDRDVLLSEGGVTSPSAKAHPAWYYQYRLKGVVAHTGGVDSGHYYSYIRQPNGSWLEFNDRIVAPFDEADIPAECFGGDATARTAAGSPPQQRSNSAYLLFYERSGPPPLSLLGGPNVNTYIQNREVSLEHGMEEDNRTGSHNFNSNGSVTESERKDTWDVDLSDTIAVIPVEDHDDINEGDDESHARPSSTRRRPPLHGSNSYRQQLIKNNSSSHDLDAKDAQGYGHGRRPRTSTTDDRTHGSYQSFSHDWESFNQLVDSESQLPKEGGAVHLSSRVLQAVAGENALLLRDSHIFNSHFLRFIWSVTDCEESKSSPTLGALAVHVATRIAVEVVCRARAHALGPLWLDRVRSLATQHKHTADNFMLAMAGAGGARGLRAGSGRWLRTALTCPHQPTKDAFLRALTDALGTAEEGWPNGGWNAAAELSATALVMLAGVGAHARHQAQSPTRNLHPVVQPVVNPTSSISSLLALLKVAAGRGQGEGKAALLSLDATRTIVDAYEAVAWAPVQGQPAQLALEAQWSRECAEVIALLLAGEGGDIQKVYVSSAAAASLCRGRFLSAALQHAPAQTCIIAAALVKGRAVDTPPVQHTMYILQEAAKIAGTMTVEDSMAKGFRTVLDVVATLLLIRDDVEATRCNVIMKWLIPVIRNSVGKPRGTRMTKVEAEVLYTASRVLVSAWLRNEGIRTSIMQWSPSFNDWQQWAHK